MEKMDGKLEEKIWTTEVSTQPLVVPPKKYVYSKGSHEISNILKRSDLSSGGGVGSRKETEYHKKKTCRMLDLPSLSSWENL